MAALLRGSVQLQRRLAVGDGEAAFFDSHDIVTRRRQWNRKQAAARVQVDHAR